MGWRAIGNKLTDYSKNDQMDWVEQEKPSAQTELFEQLFTKGLMNK